MKVKIVGDVSIVAAFITAIGTVAGSAALADDLAIAVYNGVNQLRQICGPIGDDRV